MARLAGRAESTHTQFRVKCQFRGHTPPSCIPSSIPDECRMLWILDTGYRMTFRMQGGKDARIQRCDQYPSQPTGPLKGAGGFSYFKMAPLNCATEACAKETFATQSCAAESCATEAPQTVVPKSPDFSRFRFRGPLLHCF